MSYAIPQLFSGHTAGPSCSQRGLWEDLGKNEGPRRSTIGPDVSAIQSLHWPYGTDVQARFVLKGALYLLLHVIKGIRRVDGEAYEDDMRIRVREGTETVVIFLASRIPQS